MALSAQIVAPADIQNALNRIWESLETTTVARACLFNLIFYTQKNQRTSYFYRIAQKVVEKFPSRVIFVSVDTSSQEDYLKTEVSILKSSKGEYDVACDYIQMQAGGSFSDRVPFVVLPHILPDLPVYLVWGEDPSCEDPLCYQLAQFAGRIIFDSEATENLPRFANSLIEHREKSHCDIADLNWARIESWRDMLTMAFYSADRLKQIENAKKITIAYNSQETPFFCHTKIQALYLQAWLACQLGWELMSVRQEKEASLFTYRGRFGALEIAIGPEECATLPPGLILSAEIETRGGDHFSFVRDRALLHQINFQYSTPSVCYLPMQYIFTKAESGHSLVKEICHRGTSEHYLKVLNLIKKMDTCLC